MEEDFIHEIRKGDVHEGRRNFRRGSEAEGRRKGVTHCSQSRLFRAQSAARDLVTGPPSARRLELDWPEAEVRGKRGGRDWPEAEVRGKPGGRDWPEAEVRGK